VACCPAGGEVMEWYFSIGLFLWILAQITRADVTTGIRNNILCLLLFIVSWPLVISIIAYKAYKLIGGED
ncbi:hypothetical protein ACLVXP_27910, partial [Klebsiella pneumoniae]